MYLFYSSLIFSRIDIGKLSGASESGGILECSGDMEELTDRTASTWPAMAIAL